MRHLALLLLLLAACGGSVAADGGVDGARPDAEPARDSGPRDAPATDAPPTDMPVAPLDAALITPDDPGPADVRFDVSSGMRVAPISPYVYGVNGPDWTLGRGTTFTRVGGNRMTAYNWENNASNAGSDYMFQNDDYLCSTGGACSMPGETMRSAVADSTSHGASIVVTVPMAGYVSADTGPGGDVRSSGAGYLASRFRVSVPAKGAAFSLAPDTSDANVYQDEFVNWLEHEFPGSRSDPARGIFYMLDNEPDLWSSTHAEIHPMPATYAEMASKSIALATAIKAVAPDAPIFGPVSYGWAGYVDLQSAPDAAGRDFVEFYLDAMHGAEATAGHRLLDVLDLHWYPEAQGGGVRIVDAGATSAAAKAAREQAPRSLWDAGYTETSWITMFSTMGPIRLIPLMQEKIAAHYPGTHLSFSEYNYGGGADISGAIAEADVLGILGRDGVWAASIWHMASDESFIYAGLEAFRNYDGAGATFGDTTIAATNSDTVQSSVYASVDAGHSDHMVLVAINKSMTALDAGIAVTHTSLFTHSEVWTVTTASASIAHGADVPITAHNAFHYMMPPQSVTVLVLR